MSSSVISDAVQLGEGFAEAAQIQIRPDEKSGITGPDAADQGHGASAGDCFMK